jgi:diguanylate cyclase (GGDEF)-like protein
LVRWVQVYGTGRRIGALIGYMMVTSIAGLGAFLWVLKGSVLPNPLTTVLYLTLAIVGQHLSVTFPDGNSIALADPVVYAALWAFGPPLSVLSQVAACLTQLFTQKKAVLNTFFNAGQFTISILVASLWVRVARTTSVGHEPLYQIVLVFLLILTFEIVNYTFVAVAVALDQEQKWSHVFPKIGLLQRKKTLVLAYLINMAGVLLATYMGLAGIVFVFASVFVLWLQLRFEQELAARSLEAKTDVLTGLLNVRYLEGWLEEEFPKLSPDRDICSVIFIDVDGLKGVNDRMGHDVGDAVLEHLANVLKRVVRADDKVIRYGGDEFILICRKAGLDKAAAIVERILAALGNNPLEKDGTVVEFGISAGLASFPLHSVLGRDLVRLADKAMYLAKKDGGNRYRTADNL